MPQPLTKELSNIEIATRNETPKKEKKRKVKVIEVKPVLRDMNSMF